MPDSLARVFLHFVWATKWREDTIPGDLEADVYRLVCSEAKQLRCDVLAIDGTSNHVHMLVEFGRTVSLSALMNQVKGASSRFINRSTDAILGDPDKQFMWQQGYAVFSVGEDQVERVKAYVLNQKQHHREGTVHAAWEPTEDA